MEKMHGKNLILANMWVAFTFFMVAILLGVFQVLSRAGYVPGLQIPELYFGSVSTHGVIMGFVLTTFAIMGFGYFAAVNSLKMNIPHKWFGWTGFIIALTGTLMAASMLLSGQASVMYTFYPPLKAHPLFYAGAALLVVGSWFWAFHMIWMMNKWKKENPGETVPILMFGTVANAILWLFTSLGVTLEILFLLLPWSLGWIETVDVGLGRTLFSWTLHAIVYFWLIPAYLVLYAIVPKEAGGKLFCDEMARISLIMLMVISVPIGMHHLYMDPFQAAGWKLVHMVGTLLVALPTLFTGFTVLAGLEIAGRLAGGRGPFGWFFAVPWGKPVVLAGMLSLLMLTFGGFGGLVNASYSLNALVHNTQWITGHFHLIFAGTSIIMYFAFAYYMWPKVTGKELFSTKIALWQLWLWFIGMLTLTLPWHYLGMLGQPRRISSSPYPEVVREGWALQELGMFIGGVILMVSAVLFIYNLLRTHGNTISVAPAFNNVECLNPAARMPALLNGFGFWTVLIFFYLIVGYGYPVLQFFLMETHGVEPWGI